MASATHQITALALPDGSTIETVRLGDLQIPSYQRGQVTSYRMIRNHFDINLFDVIITSKRADGHHWVVDGLQRYTARLDLHGPGTLVFCRVLSGLDIAGEVRLFEKLNRNRVRVSAFAILDAQREAGEPDAIALFEAVEKTGIKIGSQHGASQVGSPAQLREIQKWEDGLSVLSDALGSAIAAWGKNSGTFHATVIGGLAYFHRWAREQGVKAPPDQLGTKLGQGKWAMTPAELVNPGGLRGVAAGSGGNELAAARICQAWNANRKGLNTRVVAPGHWAQVAATIRNR